MYRLIAMVWLVFMVMVVAVTLPSITYHAKNSEEQLALTLTRSDCTRACILGIEPSVVSAVQLRSILDYANVPTEYVNLDGATMTSQPGRFAYYVLSDSRSQALFPRQFASIGFMFQRRNIAQININDIKGLRAADVIAALGNPTWIVLQGTVIEVRYDDLGVILKIPQENPDLLVTHIQLISERTQRNLDWFGYSSNSLQPCEVPQLLCELQTVPPA